MSIKTIALSAALSVATLGAANAATVTVLQKENSSFTGSTSNGAVTGLTLTLGQTFIVTADVMDTQSLGSNDPGCTRESNADGLTACFGNYAQGGSMLSALYGTLVGRIGNGDYFVIGSNFSGTASSAGALTLYNWDSNDGDNSGSIAAKVSLVPLPAGGLLLLGALGGLAAWRRRKTV